MLVAPAYAMIILLTGSGGAHGDPVRIGLAETVGYVLSWVVFPVAMEWLSRHLGCRGRYLSYITAYNWSSVIEHLVLLPVLAITVSGLLPDLVAQILWLSTVAFVLVYAWFVTRTALAVAAGTAAAIVVLDVAVSYTVSLMTVSLE